MARLITNTTDTIINLSDLGVSIPASTTIELTNTHSVIDIGESGNLITQIVAGNITLDDGNGILTTLNALDVLRGYSQKSPLTGPDSKLMVYESSRPLGSKIYFTCEGDDYSSGHDTIGGGSSMYYTHEIDDPSNVELYIDFNTIENESYIHEGYLMWSGALGDDVTLEFVPTVTPWTFTGTGGNCHIVTGQGVPDFTYGYLIVPAAPGTGSINVDATAMQMIQVLPSFDYGIVKDPGYWDADYNSTTHQFENIVPNYTGTGKYNMMGQEVVLSRFVNHMTLLDKGFLQLQTAESEGLPHHVRMRITFNTKTPDHVWSCSCMMVLHRKRTA